MSTAQQPQVSFDLRQVPTADLLDMLHEFGEAHRQVTGPDYDHPNKPHYAAHFYNLRYAVARELERRGLKDNILPLQVKKAIGQVADLGAVRPAAVAYLTKSVNLTGNERWITVHPHGDDEPGVPVLIKENPDGTGHIIGGAGGSLNYVKLTNLKSPEEYKAAKQAQAQQKRAEEKQRKEAMTPEAREAEKAAKGGIEDQRRQKHVEVINQVYQAMGKEAPKIRTAEQIAQEHGVSLPAAKIARAREINAHLSAVKKVVAVARESALTDHEVAAQAGLGDVTLAKTQDSDLWGTGTLGAEALGLNRKASNASGVDNAFKQRAEQKGAKEPQIAQEAKEARERGGAAPNPQVAEMVRQWNAEAKALKERGAVGADVMDDIQVPEPEKIMGLLKAGQTLKNIEEQAQTAKKDLKKKGPGTTPFVVDTAEDVDAQTVAAFKDEASVRAARALLSRVEKEDGLTKHVRNGAFDSLNEAGLTVGGREVISRDLVDAMGVAGAAQVLAARLRSSLSDAEFKTVSEAVGNLHAKTQQEIAERAVKDAEAHLDQAKQIELNTVENPVDVVAARSLNEDRLDHIEQARRILGDSYGRLNALGSLTYALKDAPKGGRELTIDLGHTDPKTAVQAARALGLNPEQERAIAPDYRIDAGAGKTILTLQPGAIEKLSSAFDPHDVRAYEQSQAIKSGAQDEEGWLPAGIERRPQTTFRDPDYQVARFDNTFKVPEGASPDDLRTHFQDFIGAQAGEGYDWDDLRSNVYDPAFINSRVPAGLVGEFEKHRDELFPMPALTPEEKATIDEDHAARKTNSQHKMRIPLAEQQRLLTERAKQIKEAGIEQARQFSADYKRRHGLDDEALVALHTQRLPMVPEQTAEAIHRTLSAIPHAKAAFTPLGNLGHEGKATLREFYLRHVAGIKEATPEEKAARAQERAAKKEPVRAERVGEAASKEKAPEPEQGGFGMFDDEDLGQDAGPKADATTEAFLKRHGMSFEQLQEENKASTQEQKAADQKAEGKAPEAAEPADEGSPESQAWETYCKAMGGQQQAYKTVQSIVRGQAAAEYAKNHGRVYGRPIKVGKEKLPNAEAHFVASLPQDKLKAALGSRYAEAQRLMAQVAQRGPGGKFAQEGEGGRVEAMTRLKEMLKNTQLGMFTEVQTQATDRPTIGHDAEQQLGSIWEKYAAGFQKDGVKLVPDLSMSGDKVKQQRGVKFALQQKRAGLHLGAGSGKSIIGIGSFTEKHARGEAKKAIFAVPSTVQGQFGSEMLRYTTPGKYSWLADPTATREERFQAYKADDPTHMIVVTHQTLRDDLIHAMAAHRGEDPKATAEWFNSQPEHTQRQAVKSAMDHHGWGTDFLAVDEAHQLLNRQGKENSSLANAIDGMSYHMPHYLSMTGTPVKNDASEAFDFLRKLDPHRFTDQGEFMRKYGVDTEMSKASLQRLMARYVYSERIPSGVNRAMDVREVDLTPKQQEAYDGAERSYRQAKRSLREGKLDVGAVKSLAPHRFEGQPEDKHAAIAQEIAEGGMSGILQNRRRQIVDEFDFDHNAKVHALREDLTRDRDKPHVIFAHNYGSISNIKRLCAELGMSVGFVNGRQSAVEKMAARLGFNPEGDAKAKSDVLINTDAGAVGQNLQRGTVLVNFDTPDTAMLHEQRIARIDRIGQKNDVTVRDYTTKTKYERTARRRLAKKYALADVFQSPSHNLDDTGLAAEIQRVRAAKGDAGPKTPAEPEKPLPAKEEAPLPSDKSTKRTGARQGANLEALKAKWAEKEQSAAEAPKAEQPPPEGQPSGPVTLYRHGAPEGQMGAGTFYTTDRDKLGMGVDVKPYKHEFHNMLPVPEEEAGNFAGNPAAAVVQRHMPDVRTDRVWDKLAKKKGWKRPVDMVDWMAAHLAHQRGHDAIHYGTGEVQSLHNFKPDPDFDAIAQDPKMHEPAKGTRRARA
jgi:hypothetical protein